MQIERFFDELAPRLETARVLDQELDRNLARRFNVLDYLKTDELGLSRIIADLFTPDATHGQGVLFLQTFLAILKESNKAPGWPDLDRNRIKVVPEQTITDQRRIDVLVKIEDPDGIEKPHCLAIENKPYAHDQENQVKDYLEHLEQEYCDRFLLIYLSPTGEGPSENSIPGTLLRKNWNSRFTIMPYCKGHEEVTDELNDFRLNHSLADWIGECRKNCDVERLRWFLRDAETFCQRTFGGQSMTTHTETKAVLDFVMSDTEKMKTAIKIYESWDAIRKKVCRDFFEQLCSATEKAKRESVKLKDLVDLKVVRNYKDDTRYENLIGMYRTSWVQYKEKGSIPYTHISLSNQDMGPTGWYIGIFSAIPEGEMKEKEKKRRQLLEEKLKDQLGQKRITRRSPWGSYVEKGWRDWYSLAPELHKECQDHCGEITEYFVNTFIEIAEKAVPVIDEIESIEIGSSKA